ncbi:hypothetical protein [Staphylococcus equorum]|uniref:hypothetical protein n=1 Tax=Staphylococcus equorum TaxID=246432 RepID=UPI00159F28CC|nr:hypothetical protein [Staphylococcus equorum]
MEFINNIKTFIQHIYADVSNYVSNIASNPEAMTGALVLLLVVAGFIVLNQKAG